MPINKNLSELKKRALIAKQRMRMGYWQMINEEKNRQLDDLGNGYNSVHLVKGLQLARLERDGKLALGYGDILKEEAFYKKVCKILEEEELVLNPIGKLLDREEYERLDEPNRQKYILDISKKFREMKERYYKEKQLSKSGQNFSD
jgi:hypothetical protein